MNILVLGKDIIPTDVIYHEHNFLQIAKVKSVTEEDVALYFEPWNTPHNEWRYYVTTVKKNEYVYVDREIRWG